MSTFSIVRTARTAAPAEHVLPLHHDFRQWVRWSPWEGLDPDLQRAYTGPETGAGSSYAWSGNEKAGASLSEWGSQSMPDCPVCGVSVQEGKKFCGGCGATMSNGVTPVGGTSKIELDAKLINSLLSVFVNQPNGLQVQLDGQGQLQVQ